MANDRDGHRTRCIQNKMANRMAVIRIEHNELAHKFKSDNNTH